MIRPKFSISAQPEVPGMKETTLADALALAANPLFQNARAIVRFKAERARGADPRKYEPQKIKEALLYVAGMERVFKMIDALSEGKEDRDE